MKKGINAWCFPNDYSINQCIELASRAGFDGLEINMEEEFNNAKGKPEQDNTYPALTLSTTKEQLAGIKHLADKNKIDIPSISSSLFWKYPLSSSDTAICDKAKDVVCKMIDAARELGADSVLIVPGVVNDDVSYKQAYDRALINIKELSKYAEINKIFIGVENVWNKFLLSPLEMRRFIEEIGSPYVGAYFDVGNVLAFSYPQYWIEILSDLIVKVHVKDFKTSIGNINGFTNLLDGDVDWFKVINAFKKTGYNDYLTAELAPLNRFPEKLIYDTSDALDRIINNI